MIWSLYASISVVTLSIATLLGRVLMKEENSNPLAYAIVFQLGLALFSFILAIFFGKFELPHQGYSVLRYLMSSLLWAGATVFGLWSVKKLNASEATIIGASSSIFTIILGVLFLGSVCAGVAVVNDAVILRTYEAFSYTTLMSLFPGVLLMLIFPKQITKVGELINKKSLSIMAIFCFLYAVQAITFYLAFKAKAPVSQLSPFTKSSIVLTVILAAIFLKERNNMAKKIVAALVVTAGVILLG